MKCLILCPGRYSISKSLIKGFNANNVETINVDYEEFFSLYINTFIGRFESLPNKIKDLWKRSYIKKINAEYRTIYSKIKPDLVAIYNNQYIDPAVLEEYKAGSKIIFILGDHPLYTPTSIYNLHILFYADYIICPDTFWCDQLMTMGVTNIFFDSFNSDPAIYYRYKPGKDEISKYGSEIVYIGSAHKNNWGYKRFLFLSQFVGFDFKAFISGEGYNIRWKHFMPELDPYIISHNRFDPGFNNMVYNCSKISPVDLVPSLFNGIHVRVWDILAAGIFPLCEYSSDLEEVFKGIDVPFIKTYKQAKDIATYLLKNESERVELVERMRNVVLSRFNAEMVISRILSYLSK